MTEICDLEKGLSLALEKMGISSRASFEENAPEPQVAQRPVSLPTGEMLACTLIDNQMKPSHKTNAGIRDACSLIMAKRQTAVKNSISIKEFLRRP